MHVPRKPERHQAASEDSKARYTGTEEAKMQPQLILIRMKQTCERRVSVRGEPSPHPSGKLCNLFLKDRGNAAAEPSARDRAADRLHPAQRSIVQIAPVVPKVHICIVLKKSREFIDVRGFQIASQQMAQRVRARIP